MTKRHIVLFSQTAKTSRNILMTLALFGAVPLAVAQEPGYTKISTQISTEAMLTLPESPGAVMASSSLAAADGLAPAEAFDPTGKAPLPPALPRVKVIAPGQTAPAQKASDKVILGLRESVTPFAILGWLGSSGYAHVTNGSPNYGTNSQAYGQRFGAAVALGVSKEIFSDSIMAPVFHQDPRYYQMGPTQPFLKRAIYSATRPVIGRTDGGRSIPNFAYLAGTAGAAALTKTYYPPLNQSTSEVFQTFGTTLGGSAIGYLVSEFGGDVARILHLSKHE